jgi:pimeloyl-ACP methyl ester carboxylesterase
MQAPEILDAREELRASGLAGREPEAYRRRAFELSVSGYFRDPRDAANLTPFRVTARTQDVVWESLGDYDLRPRLRSVPLPTPHSLVVHGTYDPIPIAGSRELAQLLGADFVELPVGHCPHVEATDAFVHALDRFLPAA